MNVNAPPFVPSPVTSTTDSFGLEQNACSARVAMTLSTEVELHRETRLALEAAKAQITSINAEARLALEAAQVQITYLTDENNQLKASNQHLKATLEQYQTHQSNSAVAIHVPNSQEVHDSTWIIRNPLEQQREFYETMGYPLGHTLANKDAVKQDDNQDKNEEQEDRFYGSLAVSTSEGQNAIYGQFLDVEMRDSPPASAPPSKDDISDHEGYLIDLTTPTKSALPTTTKAVQSCQRALKSALALQQSYQDLADKPTLQLPPSFKAKYRKPEKTSSETKDTEILASPERPNIANQCSPQPRFIMDEKVSNAVRLPLLDNNIKWASSSQQPIFDNQYQLQQAMHTSSGPSHSRKPFAQSVDSHSNYFWQYPVRFLPKPEQGNIYRTVMIDYIPVGTRYDYMMQHVRTGALESIQIFLPIPGITNCITARVVFTHEKPALSMVMQYQKRMNAGDPMKVNGSVVRVWHVLTPTYPDKETEHHIFENGYTRILLMENVEDVAPVLSRKMDREIQDCSVLQMKPTRENGRVTKLMIEFKSVKAAAAAMRRFQKDPDFKGCVFEFDRDYCSDSYESK